MVLTDTHTHLYAKEFDEDRDTVIENCLKQKVTRLFLPNIDSSSIGGMMELAKKYPDVCFPMMGLHPTSVKENYHDELKIVEDWLNNYKFCAVGEIGIDLYWDKTYLQEQQEAFRQQIDLAKRFNLPIVIHCRHAFDEIFEILDDLNDEQLKGIFHCFTGSIEQAQRVINYGDFKIGIGGVVTFKNGGLDKVLEHVDIEHIVLETDSPYITPAPFRGKRNESTYLCYIAEKVASIYKRSLAEVADVTTKNSFSIFGY